MNVLNESFANVLGDVCIFSDDGIKILVVKTGQLIFYPYGGIEKINTSLGVLVVSGGGFKSFFAFENADKKRMKELVSYALNAGKSAPKNPPHEIKRTVSKPLEYRMRCNACGQIFCYTDADLQKNQSHQKWAKAHAVGSLFGTRLDMYGQQNQMQAELDKIVDYSRCPNCKSTNLTDISREKLVGTKSESENSQVQQKTANVAEELKQFKELLDMGIITQEEFDAKKKQLLGL